MKIAVLGTGMVGSTIGSKLLELGHEVTLGSRSADSEKGQAWLEGVDRARASVRTFEDAASDAELVFNCTPGMVSLEVLSRVGQERLAGKTLIDLANPLDFTQGMPPRLAMCNETSLGEQVQALLPNTKVVKTLNTVNAFLMVEPSKLPGEHTLFISGNDAEAKQWVEGHVLREWFGWKAVVDLGDITSARGTEMYLPLWVRMWGALGTANFNIAIVRAES